MVISKILLMKITCCPCSGEWLRWKMALVIARSVRHMITSNWTRSTCTHSQALYCACSKVLLFSHCCSAGCYYPNKLTNESLQAMLCKAAKSFYITVHVQFGGTISFINGNKEYGHIVPERENPWKCLVRILSAETWNKPILRQKRCKSGLPPQILHSQLVNFIAVQTFWRLKRDLWIVSCCVTTPDAGVVQLTGAALSGGDRNSRASCGDCMIGKFYFHKVTGRTWL